MLKLMWVVPDSILKPMGGMGESARKTLDALESLSAPLDIVLISMGENEPYRYNSICRVVPVFGTGRRVYSGDICGFCGSLSLSGAIVNMMYHCGFKPDLVHCEDFPTFDAGACYASANNVPWIAHMQLCPKDAYEVDPSSTSYEAYRACMFTQNQGLMLSDAIVQVSKDYYDRKVPIVRRNDAVIITNGVDTIRPPDNINKEELPGSNSRKLGYIGRFAKMKNVVNAALSTPDDTDFIAVGPFNEGGDYGVIDHLRSIAATRGNVYLEDFKGGEEKAAFMHSVDWAIFPSRHEPFGIVGLEWMSCGTPLIATGVNGMQEYLAPDNHFKCGVELDDMRRDVLAALSMPKSEVDRRVANAIVTASSHTWEAAAQKYMTLWTKVYLKRKRKDEANKRKSSISSSSNGVFGF